MKTPRRLALWGFLLAMASGRGVGSPLEPAVEPVGETGIAPRFAFRIRTPAVSLAGTPDKAASIRLEGFRPSRGPAGAPDLPTKTLLVAIPPGVEPRLEVRLLREDRIPGVRPSPVRKIVTQMRSGLFEGAESLDAMTPGVERRELLDEDPAFYAGGRAYPAEPVRLGDVGVLRDQRYVEVVVTPVRYDPAAGGLRVARELEITVRFEGDTLRRTTPATDPRFESTYRDAFANYGQGRTFRLSVLGAAGDQGGPGSFASLRMTENSPSSTLAASAAPSAPAKPALSPGPRYRIKIRQNGVVRLDYARMASTGFLSEPLSTWKLTSRGVEVPIRVQDDDGDMIPEPTDGNNLLDPGEWVQFYGQALDDEPETILNTDLPGTETDLFEPRDFSDENIYFLTVEPGSRSRMPTLDSTPTFSRIPPTDFEAVAHQEVEDAWRPLGAADPWYWSPSQSNPTSGSAVPSRTEIVPLPVLASGSAPARVIVKLRGLTEDANTSSDHKSRITLKNNSNQTLDTNDDDGTFDGRMVYTHDFTWPGSGPTLTDPAKVTIDALSVAGSLGYKNQLILDFIEIRYRRLFWASGDALTFDWPDGDAEFEVFQLITSQPEVYEITGRVAGSGIVNAVRLTGVTVTGVGPYTARFRVDNDPALADGTLRRFVVAGSGGGTSIPADADFQTDSVSDLRNNSNQADLIVIAHPDVLDNPGSCSSTKLTSLLSHRASQGLTSKVACLQDVQDEFNDGLAGPLAIKNFLRWVMSTAPGEGWANPKPAYVLLLGDGSFNYKAGTAQGNYVPTQIVFKDDPSLGYFAGDGVMAAVVGTDMLPDLVIGRLPARSVSEADLMLQKLLDYETTAPAGNWRRHALVISDRGKNYDTLEAATFEAANDKGLSYMKQPPHTSRHLRYWPDYCGGTPSGCTPTAANAIRQDIKDEINGVTTDGVSIVQYDGHGNFDVWSDDAFFDNTATKVPRPDVEDLTNGTRLPWMIAHNCLTGGFHTTAVRMMGESWLKRQGGGSIATFAPTGLSFPYFGEVATDAIWNDLFGPRKERTLAVPVLDTWVTFCGQGSTEECEHYALLGDPTTELDFPTVAPPTSVGATCGNAQVDLAWTGSATVGATYDVYRAQATGGPYTKVNGSPVSCPSAPCSYMDTTAQNAKVYYYYVIALDADGFESRWSNFNSDCDQSPDACDSDTGDDCVKATPLNPNPPAPPTGLVVTDAETGGKLIVTWNANSETDLEHYDVHYGTSSGVYTTVKNTGKNTTTTVTGLTDGTQYYFAITATNTSGRTSAFSLEASAVPTLVQGIKSPTFVSDLRLGKSAGNIVLTWSAVTTDIYGKAETLARYEVFRGTTPSFAPSLSNKIGEPTSPTFTDMGALGNGTPNYYYLVRAVDVDGNAGGLSRQLPDGVRDLRLGKKQSPPGNLVLSWTAVNDTFHPSGTGSPTRIDHYEIYAQATPFAREQICDLAEAGCSGLTPLTSTTGTQVELTPPSSNQFYSVIAVDYRGNKSPF